MKALIVYSVLCATLLFPATALPETLTYGLYALGGTIPEGENDPTRDLQVTLAITEELGADGFPLSFTSWLQFSQEVKKGKVLHEIDIYRGTDHLWHEEQMAKVEEWDYTSDTWVGFCDAYDGGLLPGDTVVFSFRLVQGLTLNSMRTAEQRVWVAPKEMWSLNRSPWDSYQSPCY